MFIINFKIYQLHFQRFNKNHRRITTLIMMKLLLAISMIAIAMNSVDSAGMKNTTYYIIPFDFYTLNINMINMYEYQVLISKF